MLLLLGIIDGQMRTNTTAVATTTIASQTGQRAGGGKKLCKRKEKQHITHEASKFSANYKH